MKEEERKRREEGGEGREEKGRGRREEEVLLLENVPIIPSEGCVSRTTLSRGFTLRVRFRFRDARRRFTRRGHVQS